MRFLSVVFFLFPMSAYSMLQLDERGDTGLHRVVQQNDALLVKACFVGNANALTSALALKNKSGSTPLMSAVIWKNETGVALFLKHGAPDLVNEPDVYNRTPLHYAGWLGYTRIARMLLEAGAHLDAGARNHTPLDIVRNKFKADAEIRKLFESFGRPPAE